MKHFLNTIKLSFILSLAVTMAGCGGGDSSDPEEDILANKAALLVAGTATVTSVTKPANATEQDWTTTPFTITFTGNKDGGKYTTNATGDQLKVWPQSGDWTFADATGTKLLRDNKEEVVMAVDATNLSLTFTVSEAAARSKIVDGEWKFECNY